MPASSRLFALPAVIAAFAGAFIFWRWVGTPVALPDAPGARLQCLSYTPFEPGNPSATTPGWVSNQRIESDLDALAHYTDCLRVYTPLATTPRVVEAAARRDLHILLGAWIGRDREQNEKEIAGALELARRYPGTVPFIVLGNEVLLRRELTAAQLAALITSVRSQSPVPVGYADVAHFIAGNPVVVEAADLLLIHLLPYWDDAEAPPVADAVGQVIRQYDKFRAQYPGKAVMIGETGWPSKGRRRGPGEPGVVNEARFVRGFAARAGELGIRYNLIEAIDQPWKRAAEGTVGGYWGILDQWRSPKFPLQGPVSDWPDWRNQFIATATIILAFCAAGLRRPMSATRWLGWAAIAFSLGLALVFQWDYVNATRLSAWGWISGGIAAVMTVLAASVIGAALPGSASVEVSSLKALGRARYAPIELVRTRSLRAAAFIAPVMIAAAWIGLTLAFAPRHRDIPLAQFALPAAAVAVRLMGARRPGQDDRREEAMLAAIILVTGLGQTEISNPESLGWLAISVLLALPWLAACRAELTRLRRALA